MVLELQKFYQATNPSKTLAVENAEDRNYYMVPVQLRDGREHQAGMALLRQIRTYALPLHLV
jgi:hypothetical protein